MKGKVWYTSFLRNHTWIRMVDFKRKRNRAEVVIQEKLKQIVFFAVAMALVFILYLVGLKLIYKVDVGDLKEDAYSLLYEFEAMKTEKDSIVITGWAFLPEQTAEQGAVELYLYNTTDNQIVKLKNSYYDLEELNLVFEDAFDYANAGIRAEIKSHKLDFENNVYELVVALKSPRRVYKTNTYLTSSGISYIHPENKVLLDVEGTDLEQIIENGRICVFRPDVDLYMYQYGNDLYWISTRDVVWIEQLFYPLQKDKVKDFDGQWDYRSFSSQEHSVKDMNTGKYYVAKSSLPTEYDVRYGYTGGDNWGWSQRFRIGYNIENASEQ